MPPEARPPRLSVVIPSVNGWDDLRGCLEAVARQPDGPELEILVADRLGEELRERVRAAFPRVTVLAAPPGTTIPALRAMAFERALGEAVAVIEDHVLVPDGWAREMMACVDRGEDVVGGAVENAATERLVDWAAFLCEYHHLLPPVAAGRVPGVTGNNTVYRRSVLACYREAWSAGRWENHLHDAMRRGGVVLWQHPELVVGHKMHYTIGLYTAQRFLFSRAWSGLSASGVSTLQRLIRGAASALIPPLMFWRVVGTVWRNGRHRRELVRSLPLIGWFTLAWGVGDLVGWWFGPGDALARVR